MCTESSRVSYKVVRNPNQFGLKKKPMLICRFRKRQNPMWLEQSNSQALGRDTLRWQEVGRINTSGTSTKACGWKSAQCLEGWGGGGWVQTVNFLIAGLDEPLVHVPQERWRLTMLFLKAECKWAVGSNFTIIIYCPYGYLNLSKTFPSIILSCKNVIG